MKNNIQSIIKNFSHTVFSNLLSFLISTLVVLVVPKLIGVEAYGYWQLYVFYILYVGFLHFGWCDGIYLRYGGDDYDKLDKSLFNSQFYSLLLSQIILAVSLWVVATLAVESIDKLAVLRLTLISMVAINMRWMLLYTLQATNRISEYANAVMIERVIYLILLIVFLSLGFRDFKLIIWTDVIGKYLSLFYAIYCCRDFVFRKAKDFYFSFSETYSNITVGIKLMFSNIASMLIIGSVRFGIERSWDVSTFGKVSLTLSISNMLMLFINAIGLVLYPVLRRTNAESLPSIYLRLREVLMPVLFVSLLVYFPLKRILIYWLPEYADSLIYMALLFPIFVYEGKMSLLVNTYLKTLRQEKKMLRVNILSFVLSLIITFIFSVVYKNLDCLVASIVVILALRCVILEFFLAGKLQLSIGRSIVVEVFLTFIFVLSTWFLSSYWSLLAYSLVLMLYLLFKKNSLVESFRIVMKLIVKK